MCSSYNLRHTHLLDKESSSITHIPFLSLTFCFSKWSLSILVQFDRFENWFVNNGTRAHIHQKAQKVNFISCRSFFPFALNIDLLPVHFIYYEQIIQLHVCWYCARVCVCVGSCSLAFWLLSSLPNKWPITHLFLRFYFIHNFLSG